MARTIEIASNAAASSWTDLTSVVPWPESRYGGQAHDCEVGQGSGWNVDDDAGTRTLPAKRVWRAIETATTPDTVLGKGRISDKGLARGTQWFGDAKTFDASADDNNAQLYGIPVDAWVRPAETGRARVVALAAAYLNGSPRTSTVLDASTYVPNTNTVSMPKKTYTASDVATIIRECAAVEGKQAFVNVDDQLFYDLDTSTAFAAGLSITDVTPNLTTEFPPIEPRGEEQGNEFISGATLKYGTSGSVSDVRTGPEAAHDYWRTIIQDGDATSATATQRLATLLNNQSIEELTYTLALRLLDTQVDLIKYGQTVSFRSAAAGVLTPVTLRVASLYWEPIGVGVYLAHLELGVPKKLGRKIRSSPLPTPPELPPFVCIPTDFTVPWCSGVGSMLSAGPWLTADVASTAEVQLYDGATYRFAYTVDHEFAGPAAGDNNLIAAVGAGVFGIDVVASTNPQGLSTRYDFGHETPLLPPGTTAEYAVTFEATMDTNGDPCVPLWVIEGSGYFSLNVIGSTATCVVTYVSGPDPRFVGLPACSNGDPAPGQTVYPEAGTPGDGVTDTGTTNYPFVPNTLKVDVGGVKVVPIETDPTTGAYSLPYPPPPGVTPVIEYDVADTTPTGVLNGVAASVTEQVPDAVLATNTPTPGYAVVWRPGGRQWESLSGVGGALPWFDMQTDGGLVGDGVTDDTVAFQAAITAGTASGTRSCTFYFPPGIYLIGGALQSTGTMNGQILLPFVSSSGSAQIAVKFVGAARPPTNLLGDTGPSPSGYSIIKSTLTGASGTASCISGGNATNNIHVYIEDLICIAPDNPTFTFWNLAYTQGGGVRDLLIYVAPYWTPPVTQPSHSNAYGIKFPQATYSAYTYADGVTVVGFYTGILHGELGLARGFLAGICVVGLELPAMPHATKVLSYQQSGCTYGIRVTGELACDIDFYDAEHFQNPPHTEGWTVTVYDLDDPSDYLHGHVRWWGVAAAIGPDHLFDVNGAANALYEEIGQPPAGSGAVTSVALTVPSELSVTGSPVTGAGTLAVTKANQSANTVWAGPATGSAAAPAFRALVAADIPAGIGGGVGPLLITDTPAGSPLVFADLLQNEEGTDLLYADA